MIPLEWSEEGRVQLFAAFAKAQSGMSGVTKDAANTHFATKYATLAAVCEAVLPSMTANGLAVVQSPSFDGEVLTVETLVIHSDGGWMKSILNVRPGKPDAQGLGSAITYLRRYALMSLAGVAPEDDDGNAASATGEGGKKFERNSPQRREDRDASSGAAELAIRLLCDCADGAQFKEVWAKNAEGWKNLLGVDDLKRVWAVKDDMVAKFTRQAEALQPPADEPKAAGELIGADEIPY
jgi:hypothetical protein